MQRLLHCGLAVLLLGMHGTTAAQSAGPHQAAPAKINPHFARLDTNKDGWLSYQETRADREAARDFALFDENRDGRLSEDEFMKLKAAQARHRAGVYISDAAITSKVKLAMLRAGDLKSAAVHVETVAAVVRLNGEVDTLKQSERAAKLAERVKGVRKIENNLKVRAGRK